ncbi:DMT family transporter [Candidatus Eisenbacteria bacterium]|uniref:DMT family transporter n=1 Tax=Eiseniibacteriota bacterium TaxID=2212470 RepID=A0ABV6YP69_UNCEI
MQAERHAPAVVAFAIVVVSFAAILIRLCDAPTAIIAACRLTFATLILLPLFVRVRGQGAARVRGGVNPRQAALCSLAGLFLALHFLFWIESLKLTSVASSVMLVTTSPVFAAVFAWIALKEAVGRKTLLAILLCLVGSLIISRGAVDFGPGAIKGNVFAILGAAAFGAQFVIARSLRRTMAITEYAFLAYSAAAIILIGWALASGHSFTGFDRINYLWFLLLALGPQVFGHTSLSWALRYLPASKVAVSVLGEPVGAALLAWAFFGEVPGYTLFAGGALILYGVYLAITEKAPGRPVPAQSPPS